MGDTVKIIKDSEPSVRLKTNLNIWVFYSTDPFKLHIQDELLKCKAVQHTLIAFQNIQVSSLKKLTAPDLIFVEAGDNWAQKIIELHNLSSEGTTQGSEASLVVFGDETDSRALKTALRIGAVDFVSDKATLDDIIPLLISAADDKFSNRRSGELFLFLNTKGGSGASTLAVNSAVEMAYRYPNEVLLLDFDWQFGTVDDYLNQSPSYGLGDAIANVSDLDEVSLNSYVTKHASGLHTLTFKRDNYDSYEKADLVVSQLLPLFRGLYPYVIVDLSRGIDGIATSLISPTTNILMVTQQNLAAIKNTTRMAKLLIYEFGVSKEQISLIVNRYEKRQAITIKDIKDTINGMEMLLFPNDFKVAVESANLGKPFVETRKSSPLTKAVSEFVSSQLPEGKSSKSWFKRLFS